MDASSSYLYPLNSKAKACCGTQLLSPSHVPWFSHCSISLFLFTGFTWIYFYHLLEQILQEYQ